MLVKRMKKMMSGTKMTSNHCVHRMSKWMLIIILSFLPSQLFALGALSVPQYDFAFSTQNLEEEHLVLDSQLFQSELESSREEKIAEENSGEKMQDASSIEAKRLSEKNTKAPISANDFLSRGKMAFLATVETILGKSNSKDRVEDYLLMAIVVTGVILFCVLFTLVFRFFIKKKSSKNTFPRKNFQKNIHKEPILNASYTAHSLSAEAMHAEAIDLPVFFGIPNPDAIEFREAQETRGNKETQVMGKMIAKLEETKMEELLQQSQDLGQNHEDQELNHEQDWEDTAIRDFNQRFGRSMGPIFQNQISDPIDQIDTIRPADTIGSIDSTPMKSEMSLKLALAQTYLELDDKENAKLLLEEILLNGNDQEKDLADQLFVRL